MFAYNLVQIDKAPPYWIVIPASQITQPGLLVEDIPPVPKRVEGAQCSCQGTRRLQRLTPSVVPVFYHRIAIAVNNCYDVALQIVHIGVDRAVVVYHRRPALLVVVEVQLVVALLHMRQEFSVHGILGRRSVHRLARAQAVGVVGIGDGRARLAHSRQLSAGSPGVAPDPVVRRVANIKHMAKPLLFFVA